MVEERDKNPTTAERTSERALVVRRTINAPARIVFEAWTRAELFRRWWVPKSFGLTLLSCELDVRVGGKYRLVFLHERAEIAFYGTARRRHRLWLYGRTARPARPAGGTPRRPRPEFDCGAGKALRPARWSRKPAKDVTRAP